MALFTVKDAISRKIEQNHKTDYEWFVELPDLDLGAGDRAGIAYAQANGFFSGAGAAILAGAAGVARAGGTALGFGTSSTPQGVVSHRVYAIDTPFTSFESNKNTEYTSFWYSAAHTDIGNLTLRIDEMEDCATITYINEWMGKIVNDDGTRQLPVDYKRNIVFYQLNRKKDEVFKSTYLGYYPVEIAPISWSYDGTSVLQYSLTLTGDDVKHEKLAASVFDKFN